MGFARLMLPDRPLPVVSFVGFSPLHHDPNAAVAINAADLARGHLSFLSFEYRGPLEPRLTPRVLPLGARVKPNGRGPCHAIRRAFAQPFRDVQIPRSRRNRSQGTDEFMARIR